jgi:hypothetical protein
MWRNLAGHLDARRTRTDDDEGQELRATHWIAGALGLLERAEDAPTQLERVVDRLHARGELGEVIVSEVGLTGARRDDERVVRGRVVVSEQIRGDRLVLEVDVGHVTEQYLCVLLLAQDQPGRWRDLALGDDSGGHLVEQRLEQVMGGAGDQLDVDVGPLELLGSVQTAEPRTDDDDLMPIRCRSSGVAHCCSSPTKTQPIQPIG